MAKQKYKTEYEDEINLEELLNRYSNTIQQQQPANNGFMSNFVTGVGNAGYNTVSGLGGALSAIGLDAVGEPISDWADSKVDYTSTDYDTKNFKFSDMIPGNSNFYESGMAARLAGEGVGSLAAFATGQGIALKAASMLGNAGKLGRAGTMLANAPKWVQQGAASIVPTAFESVVEGGGTYNDMVKDGQSVADAREAAYKDFAGNMALLGATNFGEVGLAFAKGGGKVMQHGLMKYGAKPLAVGLSEGGQEIYQQKIQDSSMNKPVDWTGVTPEEGIQGAVGFMMGYGGGHLGNLLAKGEAGLNANPHTATVNPQVTTTETTQANAEATAGIPTSVIRANAKELLANPAFSGVDQFDDNGALLGRTPGHELAPKLEMAYAENDTDAMREITALVGADFAPKQEAPKVVVDNKQEAPAIDFSKLQAETKEAESVIANAITKGTLDTTFGEALAEASKEGNSAKYITILGYALDSINRGRVGLTPVKSGKGSKSKLNSAILAMREIDKIESENQDLINLYGQAIAENKIPVVNRRAIETAVANDNFSAIPELMDKALKSIIPTATKSGVVQQPIIPQTEATVAPQVKPVTAPATPQQPTVPDFDTFVAGKKKELAKIQKKVETGKLNDQMQEELAQAYLDKDPAKLEAFITKALPVRQVKPKPESSLPTGKKDIQMFSGIDPTGGKWDDVDLPKVIAKNAKQASKIVASYGKHLYQKGHTTAKAFMAQMKKALGEHWEKLKKVAAQVFNTLKSQRGSARLGTLTLTDTVSPDKTKTPIKVASFGKYDPTIPGKDQTNLAGYKMNGKVTVMKGLTPEEQVKVKDMLEGKVEPAKKDEPKKVEETKPTISVKAENGWLSNSHPAPAEYDGIVYPTAEHAFQAARTLDANDRKRIASAKTVEEAKAIAKTVKIRPYWDKESNRLRTMKQIIKSKFSDKSLAEKLIATGNAKLNGSDPILNQALMEIREELKPENAEKAIANEMPDRVGKYRYAVKSSKGYNIEEVGFDDTVATLKNDDRTISELHAITINNTYEIKPDEEWDDYITLWRRWAKENPDSIEYYREQSEGKVLVSKNLDQAKALAVILNETEGNYIPKSKNEYKYYGTGDDYSGPMRGDPGTVMQKTDRHNQSNEINNTTDTIDGSMFSELADSMFFPMLSQKQQAVLLALIDGNYQEHPFYKRLIPSGKRIFDKKYSVQKVGLDEIKARHGIGKVDAPFTEDIEKYKNNAKRFGTKTYMPKSKINLAEAINAMKTGSDFTLEGNKVTGDSTVVMLKAKDAIARHFLPMIAQYSVQINARMIDARSSVVDEGIGYGLQELANIMNKVENGQTVREDWMKVIQRQMIETQKLYADTGDRNITRYMKEYRAIMDQADKEKIPEVMRLEYFIKKMLELHPAKDGNLDKPRRNLTRIYNGILDQIAIDRSAKFGKSTEQMEETGQGNELNQEQEEIDEDSEEVNVLDREQQAEASRTLSDNYGADLIAEITKNNVPDKITRLVVESGDFTQAETRYFMNWFNPELSSGEDYVIYNENILNEQSLDELDKSFRPGVRESLVNKLRDRLMGSNIQKRYAPRPSKLESTGTPANPSYSRDSVTVDVAKSILAEADKAGLTESEVKHLELAVKGAKGDGVLRLLPAQADQWKLAQALGMRLNDQLKPQVKSIIKKMTEYHKQQPQKLTVVNKLEQPKYLKPSQGLPATFAEEKEEGATSTIRYFSEGQKLEWSKHEAPRLILPTARQIDDIMAKIEDELEYESDSYSQQEIAEAKAEHARLEKLLNERLDRAYYQIQTNSAGKINNKLNAILERSMAKLGVRIASGPIGRDAFGVADIANKLILLEDDAALPEEAAHFVFESLPENHQNFLLNNIEQWSEYEKLAKPYRDIYKDENKVKREMVGKLIAAALQDRSDNKFLARVARIIKDAINKITSIFSDNRKMMLEVNKIADKVLNDEIQKLVPNANLVEFAPAWGATAKEFIDNKINDDTSYYSARTVIGNLALKVADAVAENPKVADAIGKPKENVKVENDPDAGKLGIRDRISRSPSIVAQTHEHIATVLRRAKIAIKSQDNLRKLFVPRIIKIWETLEGKDSRSFIGRIFGLKREVNKKLVEDFIWLRTTLDKLGREPAQRYQLSTGQHIVMDMTDMVQHLPIEKGTDPGATKAFAAREMQRLLAQHPYKNHMIDFSNNAYHIYAWDSGNHLFSDKDKAESFKRFREYEVLQQQGMDEKVIKAYKDMRKLYNRMHGIMSTVNKLTGRPNPGYRHGYVPHYFENWKVVLVDGSILNSLPTQVDAIREANRYVEEHPGAKVTVKPKSTNMWGEESVRASIDREISAQELENLETTFSVTGEEMNDLFTSPAFAQNTIEKILNETNDTEFTADKLSKLLYNGIQVEGKTVRATSKEVAASGIMDYVVKNKTARKEDLLKILSESGSQNRSAWQLKRRKGIEGWSKDMKRVDMRYFNSATRYSAMQPFKHHMTRYYERVYTEMEGKPIKWENEAPNDEARYFKQYVSDVNGNPGDVEIAFNRLIDNMPVLNRWLGKTFGDRPSLQIANNITQFVTASKLGMFNISSSVLQAAQVLNINALLDGEDGGAGKFVGLGTRTRGALQKALKPNNKEKWILKKVGIDLTVGLDNASGYSNTGMYAGEVGKWIKTSLIPFSWMDRYVKSTAALGAYYKAKNEMGMSDSKAIQYAEDFMLKTNFDYSIADAAPIFRFSGPIGQILLQFKKYPMKQWEFMRHHLPAGKDRVAFAASYLLLAGMLGIPALEFFKNMIKMATFGNVDAEASLKKEIMKIAGSDPILGAVAKQIMYGLPAVANVDISKRIGMSDIIPSESSDFAGPAISTVWNAYKTFMINPANADSAIAVTKAISPGLGNIITAGKGETISPTNRQRKNTEYSVTERFMVLSGFKPVREAIESDQQNIVMTNVTRHNLERKRAIDNFLSDRSDENREKLRELKITMKQVKEEAEKKRTTRLERIGDNMPKKEKKEFKEITAFK